MRSCAEPWTGSITPSALTENAMTENHTKALKAGHAHRGVCAITGREMKPRDLIPFDTVHPPLAECILADLPSLDPHAMIGRDEVARYRARYIEDLLRDERGELSELDRQVSSSLATHERLASNIEDEFAERRTFGERLSDGLATFGGSWGFLIGFFVLLVAWMALNVAMANKGPFDPYPFILLNLLLSCLAAVQAPIIMMSQRRQEAKDRLRSENDYRVNLKAELEIRHLHEKMDHLLTRQWQRLAELQQVQVEIMQEISGQKR
jgi:uncharacterized membrane protein